MQRQTMAAVASAIAVVAVSVGDQAQHYRGALGLALALGVARGAAVLLAWYRPVPAAAGAIGLALVTALVSTPVSDSEPWPWTVSGLLCSLVAVALVGRGFVGSRVRFRWTLAALWAATMLVAVVALLAHPDRGDWSDLTAPAVLTAVAAGVADLIRSGARTRADLARQEQLTADELAQRLRGEERARLARELHDVVAHHLSVVVVRADSAPHRVPGLSPEAQTELAAIADDARLSLEQMRRVLRLLRADDAAPDTAPQPGLADVAELVAGARDAGADVRFADDDGSAVPGVVGLTAYRVVQEALTNAIRHAPGEAVDVRVNVATDRVTIDVQNALASPPGAVGNGLRGMRERVEQLDGTLRAGRSGNDFAVHTELPLRGTS